MQPLVSVIIPAYNSEKYIVGAISSILAQTYKNLEIIIVDDGSTDSTARVVKDKINAKRYPLSAKYIHQKNGGPSAARNRGIRESKGEYIAFLDSDDIWLPEKIERQVNYCIDNSQCGLIYTGYDTCDENGIIVSKFIKKEVSKKEILKNLYLKNVISTASTVMVRRECFDRVGYFDEALKVAEDWDMWIRILNLYDFYYINESLARYTIRKESQSYNGQKNLDNDLRFLDKIFSDPKMRNNALLKRRAYGARYYSAAIAYKENNSISNARGCLLKSFCLYPFDYFDKSHLVLILYALIGDKMFQRLERTC